MVVSFFDWWLLVLFEHTRVVTTVQALSFCGAVWYNG